MLHSNKFQRPRERRRNIFFFLFFFIIISIVPTVTVQGANSEDDGVNYSVQAILPEENQNPDVSYFDLIVEPDEDLELKLLIHNHGNEAIEIDISVADASTNRNGLIIYDDSAEIDSSLEQPLTEMVSLEEERVNIPADESKQITAYLDVPEEEFNGVKLGGFKFQEAPKEAQNQADESNEGIQINNEYVYTIGLMIRQNDEEVIPHIELLSTDPDLYNQRTALRVNLQNPTPAIIRNLDIFAEIYEDGNDTPIQSATQENGSFAPNSNMNFYVEWGNQPLEAGDYRLELSATDGEHDWEWNEEFTIEADEELEEINESAVEVDESSTIIRWLILAIILLLLIIIVLSVRQYHISRKNKK